jgi:hypothetical protein
MQYVPGDLAYIDFLVKASQTLKNIEPAVKFLIKTALPIKYLEENVKFLVKN